MPPDQSPVKPVRCAIYTRKSTEEGLDQDFNSLDAQRESAQAYILSQRSEQWAALPESYDDGGFTGANIERPALRKLLGDIERGAIDCVVVYKVDRLSRSLLDFARIMEVFDKKGVSFVSVTQPLNTSSPMGRLTLNMLLSFAQFEREIISERTRDKMRAARRRGKWTGGHPALGYDPDPETRKLVVNPAEAEQARAIFATFVRTRSLSKTLDFTESRRWTTKSRTTRRSKRQTGTPFDRPTLVRLLTNAVYVGEVHHNGTIYPGEQEGIIDRKIWEKANQLLKSKRRGQGSRPRARQEVLLNGLLFCAVCGDSMVQGYTTKAGRRYRYYQCQKARKQGAKSCPGQIIATKRIENAIGEKLLRYPSSIGLMQPQPGADWEALPSRQQLQIVKTIERIKYDHRSERAWLQLTNTEEQIEIRVRKLTFEHRQAPSSPERPVTSRIGRIMALAIHYGELLRTGEVRSLPELGRRAGISTVRVSQILKLRNLAPAIQERLLFMAPDQAQYSEVKLRRAARETEWARQSAYLS